MAARHARVAAGKAPAPIALLSAHGFIAHSTPLFAWIADTRAVQLQDALAKQGIWTRFFADPASVRFGLPATENEDSPLKPACITR